MLVGLTARLVSSGKRRPDPVPVLDLRWVRIIKKLHASCPDGRLPAVQAVLAGLEAFDDMRLELHACSSILLRNQTLQHFRQSGRVDIGVERRPQLTNVPNGDVPCDTGLITIAVRFRA